MQEVFDDTNFWVAKIHPEDQWHERVIDVEYEIGIVNLVTTETVLVETLNYFSNFRKDVKETAYLNHRKHRRKQRSYRHSAN